MKKIKNENELAELLKEAMNEAVVLKYGAKWCNPCRVLEQTIEELNDAAVFAEVYADEADEDFLEKNKITNIPVLQFYRDGVLIDRTVGLITKDALLNKINEIKSK